MYTGMAVRLAFDLGLHVSSRRYVEEGKMTFAEANARNITIWGCALNDWYVCKDAIEHSSPLKNATQWLGTLPGSTVTRQHQRHRQR